MKYFKELLGSLAKPFELDLRSLALYRICLGFIAISDILIRFGDLEAFHTDDGVAPRFFLFEKVVSNNSFSLLFANGKAWFAASYFIVEILFAIFLILGWRTKLSLFVIWILTIGLGDRMPLILHAGDVLLRMIMFWGLFLPLNARWSFDAILSDKKEDLAESNAVSSLGTAAYIMQISLLYMCTALLKSGADWRDGTAVYYALHYDPLTTSFGQWFRQFPLVMEIATYVTINIEFFIPILFFVTWRRHGLRLFAFIVLAGMHLGFVSTLHISLFAWTDIVSLLPLLPPVFYELSAVQKLGSKILGSIRLEKVRARLLELFSSYGFEHVRIKMGSFAKTFILYCIAFVFLWNVQTLYLDKYKLPARFTRLGLLLHLDQKWNMFAPVPSKDSGWYVIAGKLESGTPVDVWRQTIGQVDFSKPKLIADNYSDYRWSKYMINIWSKKHSEYRLYFGKYLCRRWEQRAKKDELRLKSFDIIYMREDTLPNYRRKPLTQNIIWSHSCYD